MSETYQDIQRITQKIRERCDHFIGEIITPQTIHKIRAEVDRTLRENGIENFAYDLKIQQDQIQIVPKGSKDTFNHSGSFASKKQALECSCGSRDFIMRVISSDYFPVEIDNENEVVLISNETREPGEVGGEDLVCKHCDSVIVTDYQYDWNH